MHERGYSGRFVFKRPFCVRLGLSYVTEGLFCIKVALSYAGVITHYVISTAHYVISTAHYVISAAHYVLSTAHYVIATAHYVISTAHYVGEVAQFICACADGCQPILKSSLAYSFLHLLPSSLIPLPSSHPSPKSFAFLSRPKIFSLSLFAHLLIIFQFLNTPI